MDISTKAKQYAEGKALNALTASIESAYTDGYNAGFNDGLESKEGEKPNDLDNSVEYVDLGLPSGTKWATAPLKDKDGNNVYLPYGDAAKLNIPTLKQYKELINCCKLNKPYSYSKYIVIIGKNGKTVSYPYSNYKKGNVFCSRGEEVSFWLSDDNKDDSSRYVSDIHTDSNSSPITEFMGYCFPVILVR